MSGGSRVVEVAFSYKAEGSTEHELEKGDSIIVTK